MKRSHYLLHFFPLLMPLLLNSKFNRNSVKERAEEVGLWLDPAVTAAAGRSPLINAASCLSVWLLLFISLNVK